jgi:gamma-D-glutamyl-L-lysine dipeptidyl-peptidase
MPLRTVRSALAPLLGEPRVSSSPTSQLLAGQVLTVIEARGDWLYVRGPDDYEGWTHEGYLVATRGDEATWPVSLDCVVRHGDFTQPLPLGARFDPASDVLDGAWVAAGELAERFPANPAAVVDTARRFFRGTSYLWAGVTPWGVDCSGLVQRCYALHGMPLPRDAWQQAEATQCRPGDLLGTHEVGDLLFFSDREDRRITHVGFATGDGGMVHSALRRGGVVEERPDYLLEQYVGRGRVK